VTDVDDGTSSPARTEGLTPAHAEYLAAHAVDLDLALSLGVRSLVTSADVADLPGHWPNWANFPAILLPWTNEDGTVNLQVRPDNPTDDAKGRPRKYVFQAGAAPVLWAVRPAKDSECMLIVEGTKQALAAATYAPPGVAVYAIAGCRSWMHEGAPIPDLAAGDGREVIVILDADAATNLQVYTAGLQLAQALVMENATKVRFGRIGGSAKAGLDDVLASRAPERRATYLAKVIESAKAKPADAKPAPRKRNQAEPGDENGERVTLICNRDRYEVIGSLIGALRKRWDGRELFNHGGVISRLRGKAMRPIDSGAQRDIIQDTCITVDEHEGAQGTTYTYTWPDVASISAVMSRAEEFSALERVAHAPFVRPDGTIVTEPGYDEATRTMLVSDPELAGLEVPEEPSAEQIAAAVKLIMVEWLGDFPFDGDADRANALALVVTPAIRGLVPRAPLAVVDGLQMGVGKNLFADSLLTVYTGEPAKPMNWVDESEELRKQITSAFRTGQEFFVFDEAHTLDGAPLAQALTAETWQDRILGVSNMAEFPNRVTWISLGNNVQVKGDITRRVYRIALRPTYANPQDRDASTFRHPGTSGLDLGAWTRKHRRDLLTAILTLARAWFAQGCPPPSRGSSFGSFEAWERTAGGIVEVAGLPGFLTNLQVWRSESDFDSQYWTSHLGWLLEQFGHDPFRTAQVKAKAMTDPGSYEAPPRLDDPADKGFSKALGEAYSRIRSRRYNGWFIERLGAAHGNVSQWRVRTDEADTSPVPPPPVPDPEPEPELPEEPPYNEHGEARGADESDLTGGETDAQPVHNPVDGPIGGLITIDLETGDADDLYRANPQEYVRLAGWAIDDSPVQVTDRDPAPMVAINALRAEGITGHNIMAFDLPALVRSGAMHIREMHLLAEEGRLFDSLLVARHLDPPMARDTGVDATRKYDLDSLGDRLNLGRKMGDEIKALKKLHGGWDKIPTDDPTFRAYLTQDVELSRGVHNALATELRAAGPNAWAYVVREHQVAAIAAQISANGFLVDQMALDARIVEIEERKAESLALLSSRFDLPVTDAKGKPYKSPIASAAGKAALETALRANGVTSLWRTATSGQLDISGAHMLHLGREHGHNPAVVEIAKAVYRIVGARSVYETAHNSLCPDGRVHPKVSMAQATGRWSVTQPGLTVFGKRGGRHVERMIFLPDPGEVVLTVDLSQVDMRAVAGLSQDHAYIEMLKHEDPHAEIAALLFGDRTMREVAKPIGHGWNYGRGVKAISEGNDIDPAIVWQFDRSMRERFPRLVEWQGEVRALAESGELLDNGFGRPMRPDPSRAHTQGPALMGQGAARDIMMTGLLNLATKHPETLPMLRAQVHDEIVLSVPADQADDIARTVVEALSFEWKGVPILADSGPFGRTWGHCYEKA
jgi:DNA polymerase I-like protein with 3'-5' exonuclease and polymerase domains